jgi:pimeloyl-ACP methyl ester carboxylesterase
MGRAAIAFITVSLVIVAEVCVTVIAYQRDLTARWNEVGRRGFLLQTAAGPIEYAEQGTGYPLLSIHGAGGGYDQGLMIVADLVGEGFRVIAPSRFGYLGTPIPNDTSAAAQADAHAAVLDALKVDRAVVVGTSAGARSAVEFAIRHPRRVTALVLLVPGTYAPTSPVMIEGSRGSAVALWLVNNGAARCRHQH